MKKNFKAFFLSICMILAFILEALAQENTANYEIGVAPGTASLQSGETTENSVSSPFFSSSSNVVDAPQLPGSVSGSLSETVSTVASESENSAPLTNQSNPDSGRTKSVQTGFGPGFASLQSSTIDSSTVGQKYSTDPMVSINLGFTLISPAHVYNGVKVASGSVQLSDGSWAYMGYDSLIDDGYYMLSREAIDTSGEAWYIISATGTQIGNYNTPDGSRFTEVWLRKNECVTLNALSLNTSNVLRQNIVRTALSLLGKGYTYGEAGPDSFDCSGFVYYVMGQNGINIPRTSTEICEKAGTEISEGAYGLRPGDIVGRSGHVGIYIGDGYFIHSAERASGVKVDLLWEYNKYSPVTNYRNVLGD